MSAVDIAALLCVALPEHHNEAARALFNAAIGALFDELATLPPELDDPFPLLRDPEDREREDMHRYLQGSD